MPRLSVDIDLTYLPGSLRLEPLAAINKAMKRMAAAIRAGTAGLHRAVHLALFTHRALQDTGMDVTHGRQTLINAALSTAAHG